MTAFSKVGGFQKTVGEVDQQMVKHGILEGNNVPTCTDLPELWKQYFNDVPVT